MILSGWGNYPRAAVALAEAGDAAAAIRVIRARDSLIARGNGRAYGDAALNRATTLSMLPSRRLDFDPESGRVTAAAGLLLSDLLDAVVPAGWFVPVTPGTKFVTIGGMVAADVHGKNHHRAGCFGDHVEALELALADGRVVRCSPSENPELFDATCGGMGLTGVILSVSFRLIPIRTGYIHQQTFRAGDLAEAMALFEAHADWTYSVAWIDCLARGAALGRSLVYLGEHAVPDELPPELHVAPTAIHRRSRRVPVDFPGFVLNRWTVRAFNELYYRRGRPGQAIVDYDSYFYPLDALLEWNRIYGRAGFVQFQCVLPKLASAAGLTLLLARIAQAGLGSFLAVLKLFGPERRLLSFPMEGFTLALDFRATPATFALLAELDAVVADHGGRVYLAKDARSSAAMMRRCYPRLAEFQALCRQVDPEGKFTSLQSERLKLK